MCEVVGTVDIHLLTNLLLLLQVWAVIQVREAVRLAFLRGRHQSRTQRMGRSPFTGTASV